MRRTLFLLITQLSIFAIEPCRIEVTDAENGWPVPLVELRTTHQSRFVTDNAGVIALDAPELLGRQVWFDVLSPGYEVPKDGFGYRGVRVTPTPGGALKIKVNRTSIAKRLGRVTGAGIFAESQKLGRELDWKESGVFGQDSVQNAVHRGKMFWVWGDTTMPGYPLGIFNGTGATTAIAPLKKFEPPLKVALDYFRDEKAAPRGVAPMPGDGPTWITGFVELPDSPLIPTEFGAIVLPERDAKPALKLVASYMKVKPPLEAYRWGLCVWNDDTSKFEPVRTIWEKSEKSPKPPLIPNGHPAIWEDAKSRRWLLFGNPFPKFQCPASYQGWLNSSNWVELKPQETVPSATGGAPIKPHSGSIAWNEFRKRWVTVFMESFGKPSAFGELWYAESDTPFGPWGPCVKILSHENYTFYNPRLHAEFTPADSPILIFEGTYTRDFANKPHPTPRYDYNQIMYRLDLNDPKLRPAQR